MVKRQIWKGILVFLLIFAVMVIGCSRGGSGLPEEGEDPGYDDDNWDESYWDDIYNGYEGGATAANPNRAVLRQGGATTIKAPDYLIAQAEAADRALTAVFVVNQADASVLRIISTSGYYCRVGGLSLGSARITVTIGSYSAIMVIVVSPPASQPVYTLPQGGEVLLSENPDAWQANSRPDDLPSDINNYRAEPTYQLAWNWRNKTQSYGASGTNCGIDLLAYYVDPEIPNRRGWVRTTFGWGGWFYNLNGTTSQMTDGVQQTGDVKLELIPAFVYDHGTPYLQITHKLTNTGSTTLTAQKFGASADVMIFSNDHAGVTYVPEYGVLMTDKSDNGTTPTLKLRLVCLNMPEVDNVDTLWLGGFYDGHRNYIYTNQRSSINVGVKDTALNFSYQNIDLAPGQSKNFVIRFTQIQ